MADLRKSLKLLWKVEYSNNVGIALHTVKGDPGGMTYKGIARNKQSDWKGWKIIDNYLKQNKTSYDMEADELLQYYVFKFYEENFWDKMLGYYIVDQSKADNIFLLGVVTGMPRSVRIAQQVAGVVVDGIFGPKTLAGVNAMDEKTFNMNFNIYEEQHFRDLVRKNPSLEKFLNGWLNRARVV